MSLCLNSERSFAPFFGSPMLFFLFLLLGVSNATQSPQTVELDLVFPHNDTYAPLEYFPIALGLQNAQAAWPNGVVITWTLWRILDSGKLDHMQDSSFPGGPMDDLIYPWDKTAISSDGYTSGKPPVDPFFYFYFPGGIIGSTIGHWKLTWRFGFYQQCTDAAHPSEDAFWSERVNEIIFRTAPGGKLLNLSTLQANCPVSPVTFRIERSIGLMVDVCPVLNETKPEPNPCALKIPESLWENITYATEQRCIQEVNPKCSAGWNVSQSIHHSLWNWGWGWAMLILGAFLV